MNFWSQFKSNISNNARGNKYSSRLHEKVSQLLPNFEENEHIKITCISGLLARVANTDLKIEQSEIQEMKKSLKKWTTLKEEEIDAIVILTIEELKDLAGLENHKYCHPLNEIFQSNEQKYEILNSLFAVAASDGEVKNDEVEEIRLICQGLKLEHKHFISAKASVLDFLSSLRS